jgi:chemotaxis protein histidine kinase CheA
VTVTGPLDPNLQAILRELRRQYLAESEARLGELRDDLTRLRRHEPDALEQLRRRLHKLAGSGGSYGLPGVTDASRAGERAAQHLLEAGTPPSEADVAELEALVRQVTAAFAEARRAESGAGQA